MRHFVKKEQGNALILGALSFAMLIGFGAAAVNPYLAFESIEDLIREGELTGIEPAAAVRNYLAGLRQSQDFVSNNRGVFDRAKEAIMAKITENEAAVAALAVTRGSRLGDVASASNIPDLDKARARAKAR